MSSLGGSESAPSIVALLDQVAAWQSGEGDRIEVALAAIEEEERSVRRRMEDAHRQLAALASIRREQEDRRLELEDETHRRRLAGVRDALALDRRLVEGRAAALFDALRRRDEALGVGLDGPEVAEALAEYLEIQERMAGQRGGLHPAPEELLSADARARLEPYLKAASAPPPPLAVERAGVGVVVSIDPMEGRPEALLMVLPVPWAVYAEAGSRPEDLCTGLAYRLVAAVHALLGDAGAAEAPVRYADLQGSLAIQVWLGDTPVVVDLRDRLLEAVATAVEGAVELQAAKIEVYALWLTPDLLVEGGA